MSAVVVPLRHRGSTANLTPPKRRTNASMRSPEYLTPDEVEQLLNAARTAGRYGHRDATLILFAYRHGLRVSELVSLRWDQIDLKAGTLHVNRVKNGSASVHPLRGPELRALRRLQRDYTATPYVFVTERGGPMTDSNVRKKIARAGVVARIPFPVHPHMLRHACGYELANDGQDTRAIQHYLGHRNITHTTRYTELVAGSIQCANPSGMRQPASSRHVPKCQPTVVDPRGHLRFLCPRRDSAWSEKRLHPRRLRTAAIYSDARSHENADSQRTQRW